MKSSLSLLIITKNAEDLINDAFNSVRELVDEIIVIDNYSTDNTIKIAEKYGAKIFFKKGDDLGKLRKFGLNKVSNDWILVLDSDERLSTKLKKEIKSLFKNKDKKLMKYNGFLIPFQNHFLGYPLNYGGENYKKLILFNKKYIRIKPALVHEKFELRKGKLGELKNKVLHYSYRSLFQMYKKFTNYAIREAKQKIKSGEKSDFKKIFLYPIHMFWARFIKDKGYKDGLFRIPLDLGFAYMEFLTYFLIFLNLKLKIKI